MRISDWSSDVCSSDLVKQGFTHRTADNFKLVVGFREFDGDLCGRYRIRRCGERCRTSQQIAELFVSGAPDGDPGETVLRYLVAGARKIGRASCRERVCQYV